MEQIDNFKLKPSKLHLKNGMIFEGHSPSWQTGEFHGEVVFNTGMTGYPESLTDPSYNGQILTFTFPLIGNFGVPSPDLWESNRIHAHGVIISDVCHNWSHHTGVESFLQWLHSQNVPLMVGVDTRSLTKLLRSHGSMLGCMTSDAFGGIYKDPYSTHLVEDVSITEPFVYREGEKTVIVVDCGAKTNIIRSLAKYPVGIKIVPYDFDYSNEEFDGVLLSNGPGDPEQCQETIRVLKKAMNRNKPIFGICLGTQIMALAAGAKTYKLQFGHRGHNQPCKELTTGRCYITSQNHGFAIDASTLPDEWDVSFINLNDQSVEGISHRTKPFFSVQFHPEAAPGPTDTQWLFDKFWELVACTEPAEMLV